MHRGLYVVMGVTGAGKSLIGSALARALGVDFVEGDLYHPPENIDRMSRGIPLTDGDRAGWLRALAALIEDAAKTNTGLVVACSALKRAYRDILRSGAPAGGLQFIFLRGAPSVIAERFARRRGHFMSPALLESQFATLEPPEPDENAWVCDITRTPDEIVAALVTRALHDA